LKSQPQICAMGADGGHPRDGVVDDGCQALPAEPKVGAAKASITHRIRQWRPSVSVSETKSRLLHWLAFCGFAIGALMPSARLRPLRLRNVSRSSRKSP